MEIGTGLGLALASEYVKLHHGEVRVDSIKGKGSSFTILLPLGEAHFPVDYVSEHEEINLVATKELVDEGANPYRFDLKSEKPLILIIDDSNDIIDFVRISLFNKYNFITAEDGEEGFTKAIKFLPEIIISDIMMPVMDGLTLCKKIKENSKTSHISMVLLTAKDQMAHKVEGIRTGADVYITKPFEMEFLEANIDHLIIRKKELSDYFKNELITEPASISEKESVDDTFVKKVINLIEANISNPDFGVEALSDEIGMSSTHLYRKLKSITHISANEIIKKYRLKKASLLLKNNEGNISNIMYDVGFSNLSYFSKCFKIEFGLTPKEFQQKHNKSTMNIAEEFKLKNESN
jgi:YesN/AraC family two-component response regulator